MGSEVSVDRKGEQEVGFTEAAGSRKLRLTKDVAPRFRYLLLQATCGDETRVKYAFPQESTGYWKRQDLEKQSGRTPFQPADKGGGFGAGLGGGEHLCV